MEVIQIILTSFIAGIVLNFMPCVLPILGIKLQSLRNFSHPKEVKAMCIFTSLGIMLFMLLTAGVFQMFNFFFWGFQLQSPLFVSFLLFVMVFLFFLSIGKINFNLNIQYAFKSKIPESFVYGFLIVIFSISCTAPVVGSAIAFASFSNTNLWIVMFFIGLGLSAPYLLFIFFPNIVLKINKTRFIGVIIKYLSSFLILCTIAFLCYILYDIFKNFTRSIIVLIFSILGCLRFANSKSILTLIYVQLIIFGFFFLDSTTFVISWSWGKNILLLIYCSVTVLLFAYGIFMVKKYRDFTILVINLIASAFIIFYLLISLNIIYNQSSRKQNINIDQKYYSKKRSLEVPFSQERLTSYIANGYIVIVNFDASWCINCKGNNLMTFNTEAFKEYVQKNNIIVMKADVTIKNEKLENFMAKFGVHAVPFTAVFSGKHPEGKLMPAFLTTQILIKEIEDYGF